MKEFIFAYYKEIIVSFCFLIEFILSVIILIKKSKREDGIVGSILSQLPAIINLVEKQLGPGVGFEKKSKAIDITLDLYRKLTGLSLSKDSKIAQIFSDAIEDILSTPTKK